MSKRRDKSARSERAMEGEGETNKTEVQERML